MRLKTKNSKSIIKLRVLLIILAIFISGPAVSQEIIPDKQEEETPKKVQDSVNPFKPFKVDGVAAVIGDYIVLDSDIDKTYQQLKAQGVSTSEITRCQLFGKLLEDKLYAHHAIQDSIEVSDAEIRSYVDQQINQFLQQTNGSMQRLLEFYNKDDEKSFREEMFEINKNNQLASKMQTKTFPRHQK